jgi:hypothetical protein
MRQLLSSASAAISSGHISAQIKLLEDRLGLFLFRLGRTCRCLHGSDLTDLFALRDTSFTKPIFARFVAILVRHELSLVAARPHT